MPHEIVGTKEHEYQQKVLANCGGRTWSEHVKKYPQDLAKMQRMQIGQ